jgi:hypothetical protein
MICFITTTFALISNKVTVEDNYYQTGTLKVDINGGNPIIEENEFNFEPGMTVVKSFYIESESTCETYYRLYLEDLEGDLVDAIEITITIDDGDENHDNDKVLYSDVASNLTKEHSTVADDILGTKDSDNGKRNYLIYFHYPSDSNNSGQDKSLSFKLSVEATQTKNNTNKEFNN